MTRNQLLLVELIKCLDNIEFTMKAQHLKAYQKELSALRACINDSLKVSHRSSFFEKKEVIKPIMEIINKINKEIERLGVELYGELHGVANYSTYISKKGNDLGLKQKVKEGLDAMLEMIIHARPEIRDAELHQIRKMLNK